MVFLNLGYEPARCKFGNGTNGSLEWFSPDLPHYPIDVKVFYSRTSLNSFALYLVEEINGSLLLCRAHRKVPISAPKCTLSYIPPWIARRDSLVS